MVSPKKAQLISKAKEKATKFVQKGDFEKALAEYHDLVKLVPDDLRYRQKLGECLAKLNRKKDAVEEYRKVLKQYADKGFLIQAVAIGKMILQLDPSLKEVQDELADLNTRRGIVTQKPTQVRPALSIKGFEGSIPSAVKSEEPPQPSQPPLKRIFEPPSEEEEALPEMVSDQMPSEEEIPSEEEAPELPSEEMPSEVETEAPSEEGAFPSQEEEIPPEEEEAPPFTPPAEKAAAVKAEVREERPIPLEEAPAGMAEVEEPGARSELPPLPETPLFSDLGVDEFKRVMEKFQIGNLPKGITVIKEGTKGDSFYIVAEGKVRVFKWSRNNKRKVTLSILEVGSFFGEFAFLTNSVRSANVETLEDCVLLRINRKDLEEIIKEFPHVRVVMDEFYRKRVIDTLLQISPLFSSMSEGDRKYLMSRFEPVMLDTGDVIIREGEDGKALYLIKNGAIKISRKHPETGGIISLAILKEGDFFGEISLLYNSPTTATCAAMMPTNLLRLPKPAFQEIIMMHPQILETVSTAADERMKHTQKSLTAKAVDRQSSGLV